MKMKKLTSAPEDHEYLGSSEEVYDRIAEAVEPAYIVDEGGTRHYFDLNPCH